MLYQVHIDGREPKLYPSERAAKSSALALARQGLRTKVFRLTPQGALLVCGYDGREIRFSPRTVSGEDES